MKRTLIKAFRYFFRRRTKDEIRNDVILKCIEIINDDENGFNEQDKNIVYRNLLAHRRNHLSVNRDNTAKHYEHYRETLTSF